MVVTLTTSILYVCKSTKQRQDYFENIVTYEICVSDVQRYGIESQAAWYGTASISDEQKIVVFPETDGIEPAVGQSCTIFVFDDDSGTYLAPKKYQKNAS